MSVLVHYVTAVGSSGSFFIQVLNQSQAPTCIPHEQTHIRACYADELQYPTLTNLFVSLLNLYGQSCKPSTNLKSRL
jgi:hypothetical protein